MFHGYLTFSAHWPRPQLSLYSGNNQLWLLLPWCGLRACLSAGLLSHPSQNTCLLSWPSQSPNLPGLQPAQCGCLSLTSAFFPMLVAQSFSLVLAVRLCILSSSRMILGNIFRYRLCPHFALPATLLPLGPSFGAVSHAHAPACARWHTQLLLHAPWEAFRELRGFHLRSSPCCSQCC